MTDPPNATPREYVTEEEKQISSFAAANAAQRCAGISVNGAEPRCCEIHLLPWGHARPRIDPQQDRTEAEESVAL